MIQVIQIIQKLKHNLFSSFRTNIAFRLLLLSGSAFFALGIRIYYAYSSLGRLDSDEGIVLLMAKELSGGSPVIFFYGQEYGGSQEALLMAPFVAIFDTRTWIARLIPGLVTLLAALILIFGFSYTKGREKLNDIYLYAGMLFLVFPASLVWWSIHSSGFYPMVIASGLTSFSIAKTLLDNDVPSYAKIRYWIYNHKNIGFTLLGISIGCGWWASPQSMMFIFPLTIWFLPRVKEILKMIPYVILGFCMGSAPWLAANMRSGLKSLSSDGFPQNSYIDRLKTFFIDGMPTVLNIRNWMDGNSSIISSITAQKIIGIIIFLSLSAFSIYLYKKDKTSPLTLFAISFIIYPLISSINPNAWYVGEARYQWFILPSMCILICAIPRLVSNTALLSIVFIFAILSTSFITVKAIEQTDKSLALSSPSSYGSVIDKLEENNIDRVSADYWTAYRISAESQREIIGTPFDVSLRIPEDRDVVEKGLDAVVVSKNIQQNYALIDYFENEKIKYEAIEIKNVIIYKLDKSSLNKSQVKDLVTPGAYLSE